MSIEKNKAIVRRFLEEAFNQRNLDVVGELIGPGFHSHNELGLHEVGSQGVKRMVATQLENLADFHTAILDLVAEDDKVVVYAQDSFTSRADGQTKKIRWMEIVRLEDGKFFEAWSVVDASPVQEELKTLAKHLGHT
jgi:predicted SnoaL-like aldol condensation-catalyzing enzyme